MHHRMPPSKTEWLSLNVVIFSTCDAPRPGRPKTMTTPEITDQIHRLILEDCRILAKSIAEQLGISLEWVGSIIHEDLDMRKLSAKWVQMPERRSKTSTVPVIWSNSGIFAARSKWFPVAIGDHGRNLVISLLPGDKATINGVAHCGSACPKKLREQKSAGKVLASIFGIKKASSLIIFQRAKLSTLITHLVWCNWRTFWRKNAAESCCTAWYHALVALKRSQQP